MALSLKILRNFKPVRLAIQIRSMSDEGPGGTLGSGRGRGGGAGGSVREAGGSFGKREAAFEEQYFRKLQNEQLEKLHDSLVDDINHHKEQIEEHEEAIERHKKKISYLKSLEKEPQ